MSHSSLRVWSVQFSVFRKAIRRGDIQMRIILASESQSRKRALDILGLTYEVHPSAIDEKSIRDSDPVALTRKLAEAKAWTVVSHVEDAVVISGDAVVVRD